MQSNALMGMSLTIPEGPPSEKRGEIQSRT